MNTEVMFSSRAMDWATPQAFFDQLDSEFHFTLDPCADKSNHKCDRYFTVADDGLRQPWGGADGLLQSTVKKCSEEAKQPDTTVVLLIPARTDTAYFHDYIYQKPNVEVRFIRGRLKFGDGKNSAPFPSMVVIFR